MLNQYWFNDRLSVDYDKNIIGIGRYQNFHIGTPLLYITMLLWFLKIAQGKAAAEG